MKRIIVIAALLVAAANCKKDDPITVADAPQATECNLFAQTGCAAGEKCAWIRVTTSADDSIGKLGCVPNGTIDVGGDCQWGASGAETGYDNCKGGLVCKANSGVDSAQGRCVEDCSTDAVTATCPEGYACAQYANYFDNATGTFGGLCDAQCDALTGKAWSADDGDFTIDNCGGGVFPAGDEDEGKPQLACIFSFGSAAGAPLSASCASNRNPQYLHRNPAIHPGTLHYANDCPTGFKLFGPGGTSGDNDVTCLALCNPADTYQGNTALSAGEAGSGCNDPHVWEPGGSPGRASVVETANCAFSWWLAADGAGLTLSLVNDVGVCMNRSLYTYTSGEPLTNCEDLSGVPDDTGVSEAWKNGCMAISEEGGQLNVPPTLQGKSVAPGSKLHLRRTINLMPIDVDRTAL